MRIPCVGNCWKICFGFSSPSLENAHGIQTINVSLPFFLDFHNKNNLKLSINDIFVSAIRVSALSNITRTSCEILFEISSFKVSLVKIWQSRWQRSYSTLSCLRNTGSYKKKHEKNKQNDNRSNCSGLLLIVVNSGSKVSNGRGRRFRYKLTILIPCYYVYNTNKHFHKQEIFKKAILEVFQKYLHTTT